MSLIKGSGGGGGGLSAEQTATLNHIPYDALQRKLVADVPVINMHEIYLGAQHKICSGSENIFFTNLTSGIHFLPMWAGIREQSIVANQGASGIIAPSGRTYEPEMQSIEPNGLASDTEVTNYIGTFTPQINESLYGIVFRAAEALEVGDIIRYAIYRGTDNAGVRVYFQEQILQEAIEDGDYVRLWFNHPSETHAGLESFVELTAQKAATPLEQPLMGVYASANDDTLYYFGMMFREFEDEELVLQSNLGLLELYIQENNNVDSIHNRDGAMFITRTGDVIVWNLQD